MDLKDIRELVKLVDKSSVTQLKIDQDGMKISISKQTETQLVSASQMVAPAIQQAPAVATTQATAPEAAVTTDDNSNYIEVKSPMVGTFYSSPSPDAEKFVKVGDSVNVGQALCIVEAMKIMNELQAETAGTIAKILVKDGEPVEFNQVLFLLDK